MTYENVKVLYASFKENNRIKEAQNLLDKFPQLEEDVKPIEPEPVEEKPEVKKDGKKPKGRTK